MSGARKVDLAELAQDPVAILIIVGCWFFAYLIGSISFAVVVSKVFGLKDPRSYGSGNPGATNVLRSGNKWAAALTLLGDAAKGWFAVWLPMHIFLVRLPSTITGIAALAVFLGHLYPIFLKFKGGKGVATAAGIIFAFSPMLAIYTLIVWILTAKISKMSSLAALVSAVFSTTMYICAGLTGGIKTVGEPIKTAESGPMSYIALIIICLLLMIRHRANIARILNGTEPKIGAKKT